MKHTKVREKMGFHLLVQEKVSEGKKGKFERVGALFSSRYAAHSYLENNKQLQGRKYRIEGVRINIEPLAAYTKNEKDQTQGSGTHR